MKKVLFKERNDQANDSYAIGDFFVISLFLSFSFLAVAVAVALAFSLVPPSSPLPRFSLLFSRFFSVFVLF